jgi:hypothetical protein
MRMRHIVICGLPVSSIIFSTVSDERRDFRQEDIEYKMCVLFPV